MPQLRRYAAAVLLVLAVAGHSIAEAPMSAGNIQSEHGCTLDYERYPAAYLEPGDTEVILAHGFQRELKHMRGWALHWQTLGFTTTIVSFCNSSWLNGHHQRNADDLLKLRQALGLPSVIYAGFSAGGLAAYLAALRDPATAAYLGLDSVDSGELARTSDRALTVPALFLTAQPSMCNARGNFQPVFEANPQYRVRAIEGATHCHFEWPFDPRCGWLCGRRSEAESETATALIRESASAWLRQHSKAPVPG